MLELMSSEKIKEHIIDIVLIEYAKILTKNARKLKKKNGNDY